MKKEASNVAGYIASFDLPARKLLRQMRSIIRKEAPKAEETIKYGMPTYVLGKNLAYFAGFKNHVSFFPAPRQCDFQDEVNKYFSGRGTLRFPLAHPLPVMLLKKVIRLRIKEISKKTAGKARKKSR